MQRKKFLCPLSSFEANLTLFLLPCRSVRLFHEVVTPGSGHDLNVLHRVEHGKFPDRCAVTPELICVNGFRNVVFAQQANEKGLGCLSVKMLLKEDVQHSANFVHGPPQPVSDSIDYNVHFIQMPPGTTSWFPVAKFLSKEGREFDVPLAEGLVTDMNTACVKQFLDGALAKRKAVI